MRQWEETYNTDVERRVYECYAEDGEVSAMSGGTISTTDGASILFPSDAFEKNDGTSYTGTVHICVHHLPITADMFSLKVP